MTTIYEFNPQQNCFSGTYSQTYNLFAARYGVSAGLIGSKLVVAGGIDITGGYVSTVEFFDLFSHEHVSLNALASSVGSPAGVVANCLVSAAQCCW
jgi:hypothetical protein